MTLNSLTFEPPNIKTICTVLSSLQEQYSSNQNIYLHEMRFYFALSVVKEPVTTDLYRVRPSDFSFRTAETCVVVVSDSFL